MIADYEKSRGEFLILIKILLNCMTIVGKDEDASLFQKYWYSMYVFSSFFSVGASAVSCLVNASNVYQVFLSAVTGGTVFYVTVILLVCKCKQQHLIGIYEMLKNGIEKTNISHRIIIKDVDTYAKCILWSHRFARFFAAFIISTIFSTLLQAILFRDYDNEDGNTLLYPSRYPWNFDTLSMYLFSYILQFITTMPILLIIWANVSFTMATVLIFQSYTEELVLKTKNLIIFTDNEIILLDDDRYYEHIKESIQLHQQLRSHFIKFKSWFNLVFNTEIAYVTVEISILSYSALKETQSFGNSIKLIFFMAVLLVQLYFHCNVGEKFYAMNDSLTETLFDTALEVESCKTQRLVMMFIQQTQMPYALIGFKTFRVSLQTMTKILRLSYNFFNVFRATDGKIVNR